MDKKALLFLSIDTTVDFVEQVLGLEMDISERIQDVFAVLLIRWIVERTFA